MRMKNKDEMKGEDWREMLKMIKNDVHLQTIDWVNQHHTDDWCYHGDIDEQKKDDHQQEEDKSWNKWSLRWEDDNKRLIDC